MIHFLSSRRRYFSVHRQRRLAGPGHSRDFQEEPERGVTQY